MARLELGSDGMVRFDGRIIAEIAYFDQEFADIIEAAKGAFCHMDFYNKLSEQSYANDDGHFPDYNIHKQILEKAGWWKS